MVLKQDQERVKSLLSETIMLLCRNGLHFSNELNIEALIGITLDHDEVFLVSVKETIQSGNGVSDREKKRKQEDKDDRVSEIETSVIRSYDADVKTKGRKRRHVSGLISNRNSNHDGESLSFELGAFDSLRRKIGESSERGEDSEVEIVPDLNDLGRSAAGNSCVSVDGRLESDLDAIHVKEESFSLEDATRCYESAVVGGDGCFGSFVEHPSRFQTAPNDGFNVAPFRSSRRLFQMPTSASSLNETDSQETTTGSLQHPGVLSRRSAAQATHAAAGNQAAASRSYRCQTCLTSIGDLNGFKEHMKRHRNIYKYYCNVCGKGFSASINLRGHLVTHTGVREFCCSVCLKEFTYKRQLERHASTAHSPDELLSVVALPRSTTS